MAKLLDRPPAALWERLAQVLDASLDAASLCQVFAAELASLGVSLDTMLPGLRATLTRELGAKVRQEVGGLKFRLPRAFDRAFRLDASALPRAWGRNDDLQAERVRRVAHEMGQRAAHRCLGPREAAGGVGGSADRAHCGREVP